MIKRIFAVLLAMTMLLLCACAPSETPETTRGPSLDDGVGDRDYRSENHRYLTLWSWQIPDFNLAEQYAKKAVECGFTAVDLGVAWSAFEPLRGHFDWTWLDGVVKEFSEEGLGVSLMPLLWTKDLSWAEDLAVQETAQGPWVVEERGSFVSFHDAQTLDTVKNTLQNFALRVSGYGKVITRWGVRLSCFGEFDYSVNEDLDYSPSAKREFLDYLKENYDSVTALKDVLPAAEWSDLEQKSCKELADACGGDWRRFRQESLLKVLDLTCSILRSADGNIPIVFPLGTFGNGMKNGYSGILDLWQVCNGCDFDILSLSVSDGVDTGLLLSLAASLTDKRISLEVDGAGVWEEGGAVAALEQVKKCVGYGIFSLSTANFTLDQLTANKETLLQYKTLLAAEITPLAADETKGVLIFSHGVGEITPPRTYDQLYGEVWNTLSENGTKPVRFFTDGQIAAGKAGLSSVTDLYSGVMTGKVPVARGFCEVFLASSANLQGNNITLVDLDGNPCSEENAELPHRIKNP
ncbi:MAG: beta-galactosidase [Clostridia bacterium]|nr:beta-galactosidase [Clostridia bacterium]